jgi:hypothetical protein
VCGSETDVAVNDLRVGERRDAVGAHASGECQQPVLRQDVALAGEQLALGARLRHALNAARTVGAPTSIDEGIPILPSAPGSGKLGTP